TAERRSGVRACLVPERLHDAVDRGNPVAFRRAAPGEPVRSARAGAAGAGDREHRRLPHVLLPSGLVMAAIVFGLELHLAITYRAAYRSMLKARVSPEAR